MNAMKLKKMITILLFACANIVPFSSARLEQIPSHDLLGANNGSRSSHHRRAADVGIGTVREVNPSGGDFGIGTVREVNPSGGMRSIQIGAKIGQITTTDKQQYVMCPIFGCQLSSSSSLTNRSSSQQVGVGVMRELGQMPDSKVQIGAQIRKIIVMKREANPFDDIHKMVMVDEGEEGVRKQRKASPKAGAAAAKDKGGAKIHQKSVAKVVTTTTEAPQALTTATTPATMTTTTTATAPTKAKETGKEGGGPAAAVSEASAATANSEAKTQAKNVVVPQGPPMPPPRSAPAQPPAPPSHPSQPEQTVVVPPKPVGTQPSTAGMALPMPIGVGGKLPNFKLIYFDARGICEPIRLIFHYAKVPFDDVRISRKQWLALKDSTVYGKVPILEVDGKPLTYCHTIARYLARSFGLAGRTDWEQAKVDEISDFHADVALDLQPYMYVVAGFHQGDRQSLRNSIFLPNVEKHFPVYVSLLKQSGGGFFISSGITWVDFVISEYMTTVRQFEPKILEKYPAINKFIHKVQTQPQIFDYITHRENLPVRAR